MPQKSFHFRSGFTKTLLFLVITFGISKVEARLRLLTNGSLARGALDSKSYRGETPYDHLQKKFDRALTVKIGQVGGWYAGRCFFSDSPMQPVASLLVFSEGGAWSKSGPLFQSEGLKTLVPLIDSDVPPNALDHLSSPKTSALREALKRGRWNSNSFAIEDSDSLVFDGLRTFETEARTYEIRRDDKYLFLRLSCAEPGFCLNDRGQGTGYKLINNEGESTTACYYFKRILKPSRGDRRQSALPSVALPPVAPAS